MPEEGSQQIEQEQFGDNRRRLPKVLAGCAVLFTVVAVCLVVAALVWWFFLRNQAVALPAPEFVATEEMMPTPEAATPTPSLDQLLDNLSTPYRSLARAWLEMGLPPDEVATLLSYLMPDPQGDGIYSIQGVTPGIISALADIRWFLVHSLALVPGAEDLIFNQSIFKCSDRSPRAVICPADVLPMPPGDLVAATMILDGPIPAPAQPFDPEANLPIPSSDMMLVYAFVVDRNGDPTDNFNAVPPYDWDYYQGTDTWYELVGDPEYGLWVLYATDARRQPFASTARAVIDGDSITFFVAAEELGDLSVVRYRMSAFQTDGSYQPEVSTGDVTGADPQQELIPILETNLTVLGPSPDSMADGPAAEPVATVTPDIEAETRSFIAAFSRAHEEGDVDFLYVHLGLPSLDRYGPAQCRGYLEARVGTATEIEVVSTEYPVDFNYSTDGRSTLIPGAIRVNIHFLALGEPTDASMHVLIDGGQAYWFTDCGDPVD